MTLRPRRAVGSLLLGLALAGTLGPVVTSGTVTTPAVDYRMADGDCTPGTVSYIPDVPDGLVALQSEKVWKRATGAGIVVAVVDSGIDANNDHLTDAIIGGVNLVADGENAQGLTDLQGHGTAIAGLIAARPVDGSGVIGIAPNSHLLSVRVFRAQDETTVKAGFGPSIAKVAEGIRWAADNGADIINVSISDYAADGSLKAAVEYAQARGILIVASAGNATTTTNTNDSVRYPAGYPGVIGVAAGNGLGRVQDSIAGPQVSIVAPGTRIQTSATGAGDCIYATEEASTSFATGYTSGVMAAIAEAHPDETPEQWKYRVEATATRMDQDRRDDVAGWGIIQPYDALTLVPSASTRGPESPFADTADSAVSSPTTSVVLEPSNSPFEITREAMIYVTVTAASVLGVFALIVVLRRARRSAKGTR